MDEGNGDYTVDYRLVRLEICEGKRDQKLRPIPISSISNDGYEDM